MDIESEIIKLIRSYYGISRDALIDFEVTEAIKSASAGYEYRDFVDHCYLALQSESLNEASAHIASAAEHLRRAVVEPFEWGVENRLAKIQNRLKYRRLYILLFVQVPSRQEILSYEDKVKRHIAEGRRLKGDRQQFSQSCEHFRQAHSLLIELDRKIDIGKMKDRLFAILLIIFGALLAIVFQVLFL